MYDTILVPLDGSALAEQAIPYAALIPSRRVRLIQVEPSAAAAGERLLAVARREWRAPLETIVADYLGRAGAPLRERGRLVEPELAHGDPAERIVAAAAEADLIVMTTQGQGAGGRRVFGSVADRVARHSPVPTLVVRGGAHPVERGPVARLLVPLDGSPVADRALPVAERLARELALPIHLVAVADVAGVEATLASELLSSQVYNAALAAARRNALTLVEARAARLTERGLAATTEVRGGPPAVELMAAIRPGDLVVMTTHGAGGAQRWVIGSVAEKVLRQAPVPVLLIRGDAAARAETATVGAVTA